MNKVIIKKGPHKGQKANIINSYNNGTLRIQLIDKKDTEILLSEDDVDPI